MIPLLEDDAWVSASGAKWLRAGCDAATQAPDAPGSRARPGWLRGL